MRIEKRSKKIPNNLKNKLKKHNHMNLKFWNVECYKTF